DCPIPKKVFTSSEVKAESHAEQRIPEKQGFEEAGAKPGAEDMSDLTEPFHDSSLLKSLSQSMTEIVDRYYQVLISFSRKKRVALPWPSSTVISCRNELFPSSTTVTATALPSAEAM